MELPFELYENHKYQTLYRWKGRGLICSEEHYDVIYERYIFSSH